MNEQGDDYYYRLGRYQGVIELISDVPKSRPFGISNEYCSGQLNLVTS